MNTIKITSSATYNAQNIRTSLWRTWDSSRPTMYILMWYPSTANEIKNDKTIDRCISIAKNNNYGSITVYNIGTYKHDEPWSVPLTGTDLVIAWGAKISNEESRSITSYLSGRYNLYCFKKLKDGRPGLPTRLPNSTVIVRI